MTKEETIVGISDNEDSDFNQLYEKYKDLVYRISLKYSDGDCDLAEDAVQHTFLVVYKELQKEKQILNIKSYLHTIAKNYTLNQTKKLEKEVPYRVTENEEYDEYQNEIMNSQAGMTEESAEDAWIEQSENAYYRQMTELILEEVKEKNEKWYIIIKEVFVQERNQVEVAKELNMSNATMYATIRRIREWSTKHKIRFEQEAMDKLKEMPKGHLFI